MTLWSVLKTYLRTKPVGATCACGAARVAILLFLRLSGRQPFVEISLADDFQHAVHFVVAEAAKLGARDFVIADLGGSEVHVDCEARNRVLLEAHGRNKKAVDD